jgi:hypothetical protein
VVPAARAAVALPIDQTGEYDPARSPLMTIGVRNACARRFNRRPHAALCCHLAGYALLILAGYALLAWRRRARG